jgi:hypothetical protein
LDQYIVKEIENEEKMRGCTFKFGEYFHLQHWKTAKYLAYAQDSAEGAAAQLTLRLEHQPSERAFFKILPCYAYQKNVSPHPRFLESYYIQSLIEKTKEGFLYSVGGTLSMDIKQGDLVTVSLYSEVIAAPMKTAVCGQMLWLVHAESKGFLLGGGEAPAFSSQPLDHSKRDLSSIWKIERRERSRGGPVKYG